MTTPHPVLVLLAHPTLERSRVNRRLAAALAGLDGVTVHDLYEAYPDLDVDVTREQELLLAHDVVVLQHPFHWYSTPAILKQWQDLVLEHGWAYIREAKQRVADLEELLQADHAEDDDRHLEAAWDDASLRAEFAADTMPR